MDDEGSVSERHIQEMAFRQAQQAANAKDPIRFLAALSQEKVLDGLIRKISFVWNRIPPNVIEDTVTQAVDELYALIGAGQEITDVVGLLRWRADKRVYDYAYGKEYQLVRGYAPESLALQADLNGGYMDKYFAEEDQGEDEDDEQHRAELFSKARQLVPSLGEQNIQTILTYLLDAIEDGRISVPNKEIAEAVGLSVASTKSLKSRAIDRFLKRASEVGLPGLYVAKVVREKEDTEESAAADGDAYWDRFDRQLNKDADL